MVVFPSITYPDSAIIEYSANATEFFPPYFLCIRVTITKTSAHIPTEPRRPVSPKTKNDNMYNNVDKNIDPPDDNAVKNMAVEYGKTVLCKQLNTKNVKNKKAYFIVEI